MCGFGCQLAIAQKSASGHRALQQLSENAVAAGSRDQLEAAFQRAQKAEAEAQATYRTVQQLREEVAQLQAANQAAANLQ
eukprot:scaffold34759_cov23-Prasinocladus_malaysianus.AAC.1